MPGLTDSAAVQNHLYDLWYRAQTYIDTHKYLESTSIFIGLLSLVLLFMSWSSRIGSWGGRFSPFGRTSTGASTEVSDADYSYITSDDLKKAQERSPSPIASGPPRDTDTLVLKSKKISHTVHFPAYSIEKGELSIGAVREQAAKKTSTSDSRRIKLFYKGKNLKDDTKSCRAEGLRQGGEIMCVIGDALPESASDSESEDELGANESGAADGETPKRKRNRNRNRKKKGKKQSGTSTPSETLAVPPAGDSRAPSPRPAPTPLTPLDKLNAVSQTLHQTLLPQCVQFTLNPPTDPAKKTFEHKKLGELVLAQVLLKLDAVETEGDPEARARRKELVKEAQTILNGLDEAMKPKL